jgi:hypothetical protein
MQIKHKILVPKLEAKWRLVAPELTLRDRTKREGEVDRQAVARIFQQFTILMSRPLPI